MMSDSMLSKLKHLLVEHEGYKNFPYTDTVGKLTIGVGYNLTDRGLPDSWVNSQLNDDIAYFNNFLHETYPWFKNLTEARQIALIDMCFMGVQKFKTFKRMLAALEAGNYNLASFEMLSSKWANQVKDRADMLAHIMLTGES